MNRTEAWPTGPQVIQAVVVSTVLSTACFLSRGPNARTGTVEEVVHLDSYTPVLSERL